MALVKNYTFSTNITENFQDETTGLVTAGILLLLGLLGNGFICVSFSLYRQVRTLTNYYIVNLATADLLQMVNLACWLVFAIAEPHLPMVVENYLLILGRISDA